MNNHCKIDLSDFKLTVDKIHNNCKYFRKGNVNLNFLPKNICIIALHTILPYYFSLLENAWFRWEKNKNSVTAFCPIAASSVGMDIIKVKNKNKKEIMVKIKDPNNLCGKGYGINYVQKINFFDRIKICPRALYEIIPYIFYLNNRDSSSGNISFLLSCPGCKYGKVDILLSNK